MWRIGQCIAGDVERTEASFKKYYPYHEFWYPKKIRVFHKKRQKCSDEFIRTISPVFGSYVFFKIKGDEPNWAVFPSTVHMNALMKPVDDYGNDDFEYLPDSTIAELKRREDRLEFCDSLTKAVLKFEQLVGMTYIIPRGIFAGKPVTITKLQGSYVHFLVKINGREMAENAPATLIADLVPRDILKNLKLPSGSLLPFAADHD